MCKPEALSPTVRACPEKFALEEDMKILVAIDDSQYSEAAIRQLIAQAPPRDTQVRVLHVIEAPSFPDNQAWDYAVPVREVGQEQREEAE